MTQLLPLNAIENPPSFRNAVINGDCRVAQRGNVAVSTNTTQYGGADRIYFFSSGFTTISGILSQISGSATTSGYAQSITLATTGTGQVQFGTRIESRDTRRFNSKTVTLSLKLYQDTGSSQVVQLALHRPTSVADNFITLTQLGISAGLVIPNATWTSVDLTVALGAADANNGLQLSAYYSSLGAMTSKVFAIGDITLEQGAVVSAFESRSYGVELALCQRFYEVGTYSVTIYNSGAGTSLPAAGIAFKVPKIFNAGIGFSSVTYANCSALAQRGSVTTTFCPLAMNVTAAGLATADFTYVATVEL